MKFSFFNAISVISKYKINVVYGEVGSTSNPKTG